MIRLTKGFPHPVLGLGEDVVGKFQVKLTIENEADENMIDLFLDYSLDNSVLEEYIAKGKAEFAAIASCSATMTTWTLEQGPNLISKDHLMGTLKLSTFIVASEDVFYSNAFSQLFDNLDFQIEKGGILAFGGEQTIHFDTIEYNHVIDSLFFFTTYEDARLVDFSFEQDRIHITVPMDDSSELLHSKIFRSSSWAGYFAFAQPALQMAFEVLKESKSDLPWKWAEILKRLRPQFENEEPYISAQRVLEPTRPLIELQRELQRKIT